MIVTRRAVFETNSSSTHSICVSLDTEINDGLYVNPEGICKIYPGEFGWGYSQHNDAASKASYMLTHVMSSKEQGYCLDEVKQTERLDMLRGVIQSVTGAKEVEFVPNTEEYWKWGYIDHQSIESNGGAGEPVWQSPEVLRRFIFSRESLLEIDHDNH